MGGDEERPDALISIIEKLSLLEEKIEAEKESSAAADARTMDSDKVQDRIAKTMAELAKYQQGDGSVPSPGRSSSKAPRRWRPSSGGRPMVSTPAPHLRCRAPRARAAGVRVGGRAQLVHLWRHQDDGTRAAGPPARPPVADKRVYCRTRHSIHLKGKLQTAGYKQAVEKWDTDSDSYSSDEEDLKM